MPIKSEFESVPEGNAPLAEVLLEAIWKHSVKTPEKLALIDGEDASHKLTFSDVYMQTLSVASFLEGRHFGHGDVACVIAPNCLEYLPICLGISHQGGTYSGASPAFTEYEISRQVNDCGAKLVFAHGTCLDKVLKGVKNCPKVMTIVTIAKHNTKLNNLPFGVVSFDEVLLCKPNVNRHRIDIDINRDIALLPYSSGTTGAPKGVMLSHKNIVTQLYMIQNHFDTYLLPNIDPNFDPDNLSDVLFMPFYHIYGFVIVMINALRGSTSIVLSHFDPNAFCRCIQDHKIKFLKVVPPILVFLAKHPITEKYDLSSVLAILTGAAPAGKELCEEVMKRMPNVKHILQAYGMTEVSGGSHLAAIGKTAKFGNAGKLVSNTEKKIINPESGQEVPLGERGEICIRGPTVMLGYLNRRQATADTIDDDGWLHTGDIGYVDEEGYLFIVDRLKELIKVKGFQVPPAELEDLLITHPLIQDAAVIGIPDPRDGEHPLAFVVRKSDALSESEVAQFVKKHVSSYKQLRGGVQFIQEIPKAASGKILRRFLRDEAAAIRSAKEQKSKL